MLLPSVTWAEIPQVMEQGCYKYFLAVVVEISNMLFHHLKSYRVHQYAH